MSEEEETEGEAEGDTTSYAGQCTAACQACVDGGFGPITCSLGARHKDDGFAHFCDNKHTWQ